MNKDHEKECLRALKEQGAAAGPEFDKLYKSHRNYMLKIAWAYGNNSDDVDEIMAEAAAYLWQKLAIDRADVTYFRGFAAQAVRWKALDHVNGKSDGGKFSETYLDDISADSYDEDGDAESVGWEESALGMDRGQSFCLGDGHYRGYVSPRTMTGGLLVLTDSFDPILEELEGDELAEALREKIASLPKEQIEPITDLVLGHKQNEVAEKYGLATSTVNDWYRSFKADIAELVAELEGAL